MPRIHVIIPCFNEAPTLSLCIERLMSVEWPDSWQANLIIVDDCSEDATRDIAEKFSQKYDCIKALTHDQNRGKGSAVRTGFTAALQIGGEDDLIVIQDADLEYHPSDLIEAIKRFDDCFGAMECQFFNGHTFQGKHCCSFAQHHSRLLLFQSQRPTRILHVIG